MVKTVLHQQIIVFLPVNKIIQIISKKVPTFISVQRFQPVLTPSYKYTDCNQNRILDILL